MNFQSSNFLGERSWNKNIWKGLKVDILLKVQMKVLLFVNLCAVQKIEQVKQYL